MSLTLCHTADWHLGRTLHGAALEGVHRRFLRWLADQLVAVSADVLVVAGDVFDRSVPSASAEQLFFGFLAELAERAPGLEVVVVAGNHDGASRLAAPAPLLGRLGVRIVGSVPTCRGPGGTTRLELGGLVVPLRDRAGRVHGRLLALPFLRPADLSLLGDLGDGTEMLARVRALHGAVLSQAGAAPGLTVATAHAHVRGARLSPDSERPLLGGDEASWPIDVFPAALDYVAAGHLHLAQSLDGGRVRYAGSPVPLAFSEREHPHQVVVVRTLADGEVARADEERVGRLATRGVRVPPFLRLVRVEGKEAPLDVEGAARALGELDADGSTHRDQEIWVQVRVELSGGRPALKHELAQALARSPLAARGAAPRLVHVDVVRARTEGPSVAVTPSALSPASVLEHVWRTSVASRGAEAVPVALREALEAAWLEAVRLDDEDEAERPEEKAS